jgi:hypothetical protein
MINIRFTALQAVAGIIYYENRYFLRGRQIWRKKF